LWNDQVQARQTIERIFLPASHSKVPKRVLIVTGDFVVTGGMDRANFALADYLARQGTQVELVAYRVAPELTSYPNVIHHRVNKPANSYLLGMHWLDREGRRRAQTFARLGGRVITNGGNCLFGDVNWVHYVHAAYRPETRTWMRRLKQSIERPGLLRAERRSLTMAKLVIANSDATRKILIDKLALPAERVRTIYYGIDTSRFRAADSEERQELRQKFHWDDAPRVVFVGALGDRRKGFDTLAAAWTQLCQRGSWDAKLVVIGSGADQAYWKRHLRQQGCGNSIEFLGFRSDVPELLRAADCLVAPTRYEAYGLGVHEAICSGLPAFVTRLAGVAERYPESLSDLLLDSPDDANELASKLSNWRTNASKWPARLRTFSEYLQIRSWDGMAAEIMEKLL